MKSNYDYYVWLTCKMNNYVESANESQHFLSSALLYILALILPRLLGMTLDDKCHYPRTVNGKRPTEQARRKRYLLEGFQYLFNHVLCPFILYT